MSTNFPKTDIPESTILKFIYVFSRMEFALKKAGYILETTVDGEIEFRAEPNWNSFWNSNKNKYRDICLSPSELCSAHEYIMNSPPKKQILNDELNLDFKEVVPKEDDFCVYIRRVRNNLFHGGKFSTSEVDTTRDRELLENSIIILNSFVNLDEAVKNYYNEETYSLQNEDNDS